MLRIKLSPTGKKGQRHFRIVIMEENSKITGSAIDTLGHYHPHTKETVIDADKLKSWLAKGAQPTLKVKKIAKI